METPLFLIGTLVGKIEARIRGLESMEEYCRCRGGCDIWMVVWQEEAGVYAEVEVLNEGIMNVEVKVEGSGNILVVS